MAITGFSQKTKDELNYYVYGLIDPRNNELFYVGKGTGDRVFEHEANVKKNGSDGSSKEDRIQEIFNAGLEVTKIIFIWGLKQEDAYVGESTLINATDYMNSLNMNYYLTNKVAGHHGGLGAMEVNELEKLYGAQPIDSSCLNKYKLMVVKLNRTYRSDMTDDELYEVTRGNWRASLEKAKQADYVLAVYKSLVVGVYKPDKWRDTVTNGSFHPLAPNHTNNTNGYVGRKFFVDDDYKNQNGDQIKNELLNKKIDYKSINPIVYLY